MSVTNVIDLCLATTSFRQQTEHQTKYNMTSLVMSLIAENQGIILKYRHPGKRKRRSPLFEDCTFPLIKLTKKPP